MLNDVHRNRSVREKSPALVAYLELYEMLVHWHLFTECDLNSSLSSSTLFTDKISSKPWSKYATDCWTVFIATVFCNNSFHCHWSHIAAKQWNVRQRVCNWVTNSNSVAVSSVCHAGVITGIYLALCNSYGDGLTTVQLPLHWGIGFKTCCLLESSVQLNCCCLSELNGWPQSKR